MLFKRKKKRVSFEEMENRILDENIKAQLQINHLNNEIEKLKDYNNELENFLDDYDDKSFNSALIGGALGAGLVLAIVFVIYVIIDIFY